MGTSDAEGEQAARVRCTDTEVAVLKTTLQSSEPTSPFSNWESVAGECGPASPKSSQVQVF